MRNSVTLIFTLFTLVVFSQTSTKNYIKTIDARQELPGNLDYSVSNSSNHTKQNIQYYDGLGRPLQSIVRWGSPDSRDLLTLIEYDVFGRQTISYLPYETTFSNGNFINTSTAKEGVRDYYNSRFTTNDGNNAFLETRFEASPLNRVVEESSPGYDWRIGSGNTVSTYYMTNDASEVKKYEYSDLQVSASTNYATGELFRTVVTDEDGNQIASIVDKLGRTIKKESFTGSEWAETYYIYDESQRLRVVLPPQANVDIKDYYEGLVVDGFDVKGSHSTVPSGSNQTPSWAYTLESSITISDNTTLKPGTHIKPIEILTPEFLDIWAFQYDYDDRNRMISKQVPGADPVYMVYDQWDRLVLTQDGNQRASNEWFFTKYDGLNRPVLTGKKIIPGSLQSVRDAVKASGTRAESYGSGPLEGYTNNTYPSSATASDLLTVTYYDNHTFVGASDLAGTTFQPVYVAAPPWHIEPIENPNVKGQVTGTLTRAEGTDFITSITYYDDKYRPIQMVAENHLGGTDRISNQYDFVGNIRKTQTAHSDGSTTTTIKRRFTYDHMDRLVDTYHQIDSETEVLLAHNDYDNIGQLVQKDLHEGEQLVDYDYNIRGWLTSINESNLSSPGDPVSDLFGMELYYNTSSGLSGHENRYNGNISAMRWSNYDINAESISGRAYEFDYDGLNRLTDANHIHNTNTGTSEYDVTIPDYDLNGNIKNLTRKGKNGSNIDNLTYTYDGNQLLKVTDAHGSEGFDNGSSGTGNDYTYDENGNMISDANKGITNIDYNHLNLPTAVTLSTVEGSGRIEYLYDAAGIKLQQKVYEGGSLTKTTDYVGEFIYETEGSGIRELQLIQHEEGRLTPLPGGAGGGFDYQYHLKDHLGNVRLTFSTTPENYTRTATFEDANLTTESVEFGNLDTPNRVDHPAVSNTGKAARINNASPAGPFAVISINKGDTLNLSAKGYYAGGSGYSSAINPATFETALGDAFKTSQTLVEGGVLPTQIESGVAAAIAAIGVGGSNSDNVPGAYLNYLYFDTEMNLIYYDNNLPGAGFAQISSAASFNEETIEINNIIAHQEGYIIAYLSNESNSSNYVYFDDFTVTHKKTNIVSTQDYYPFGLTFNESVRVASKEQRFKYNGKELQEETGWIHYGVRYYDPEISRWMSPDPLSDMFYNTSPYVYSHNNPLKFVDPDGAAPTSSTGDCCKDGSGNVADDQVVATLYLQFVAARKNLASTIAGFIQSGSYNPYIVRKEYSVGVDGNGQPFLNESQPYLASKSSAGFYAAIDAASLYPGGGGVPGFMAKNGMGPTIGKLSKDLIKKYSGSLVQVNKADDAADALAEKLGGKSRMKFDSDPLSREFDAVSDEFIGQTKSSTSLGKAFRDQAKATFEAAASTGRKVYYEFTGGAPSEDVIKKLMEYSERYNTSIKIDIVN
ncbi:DUF6443 domain-containing protein [Ekhidna sp.]|uniref:DUF6443 domain-containing protein n=1 Tax=Ekhidna sp. TaxID=2608089 RepID=UPI003BA93676